MFGSGILEVAIGLLLVYLLLSLICSAVREGVEAWMKTRSVHLERGIRELLHDLDGKGLAQALYNHPLVFSLYQGGYDPSRIDPESGEMKSGKGLPSYIPARNFALALMDIVARGMSATDPTAASATSQPITLDALRASVAGIGNPRVQRALLVAIDMANGNLARAQKNIETWFDSGMDRVSGWYKRRTQYILFFIGLFITIVANANTIVIAQYLARNDLLRESVVAQAAAVTRGGQPPGADVKQRYADLEKLGVPMGWEHGWPGQKPEDLPLYPKYSWGWFWVFVLNPILGWAMTAVAISLGAPFWFDLLNKFMVIRSTVKPHEKSPEEASEDRQVPSKG
ncbi:MAG TPA: hypothetical protein VK447_01760 [Myxococcaceae bacterium]|nr:hypothetical protein [Myxococcaceae bacterium]